MKNILIAVLLGCGLVYAADDSANEADSKTDVAVQEDFLMLGDPLDLVDESRKPLVKAAVDAALKGDTPTTLGKVKNLVSNTITAEKDFLTKIKSKKELSDKDLLFSYILHLLVSLNDELVLITGAAAQRKRLDLLNVIDVYVSSSAIDKDHSTVRIAFKAGILEQAIRDNSTALRDWWLTKKEANLENMITYFSPLNGPVFWASLYDKVESDWFKISVGDKPALLENIQNRWVRSLWLMLTRFPSHKKAYEEKLEHFVRRFPTYNNYLKNLQYPEYHGIYREIGKKTSESSKAAEQLKADVSDIQRIPDIKAAQHSISVSLYADNDIGTGTSLILNLPDQMPLAFELKNGLQKGKVKFVEKLVLPQDKDTFTVSLNMIGRPSCGSVDRFDENGKKLKTLYIALSNDASGYMTCRLSGRY